VLAPHIERAVLAGGALAVALHLYRELQLEVTSWTDGDALHLRPRGVLWFATAPRLEEQFLERVSEHAGITQLVVHLDALGRIDMTAALALRTLLERARRAGIATSVADVRPRWRGLVANVIAAERDPLGGDRP
jgi:SulP family sulfate permease